MDATHRIEPHEARIIEDLYEGLRRFAAAVAPWRMDPDDVLHAALLDVIRSRRLSDLDDPAAYLRRAIVNQVKSTHRRAGVRRTVLARLVATEGARRDEDYPSDLADLLRLQPLERAVLYLHDIEGYPFGEVAPMVGVAEGNARVIASRARRRLRALLSEEVDR